MDRPFGPRGGTPPSNNLPSTMNDPQYLLESAQLFSQMAVQHVHQIRQHVDGTDQEQMQAADELMAAYDKLSSLKWDAVRKEYEASYRANLEDSDLLRDTVQYSKTPGKKKSEENGVMPVSLNPHDWIANAFRNRGRLDTDDINDLDPTSPALAQLGLPPPGFDERNRERGEQHNGDEQLENEPTQTGLYTSELDGQHEQQSEDNYERDQLCDESFCSSEKETTVCTSTPSEVSSLGTQDVSCDEERDDSSIDSFEDHPFISEEDFDYVYKGGYAMKASNGQEINGVVPRNVKHVLVHSSVTSIDEGAFQGCHDLESVTISSSVVSIGNNAFRKCSKLKQVEFLTRQSKPNSSISGKGIEHPHSTFARMSTSTSLASARTSSQLRNIGDWAFFNCSSLESINFPHGLDSVGTRAFQRCSSLQIDEFPSTLRIVGDNAFSGCARETRALIEQWEKDRA